MYKNFIKSIYKKKIKTIVITSIFLMILLFNVNFFNQSLQYNNIINNNTEDFGQYDHNLKSANGESILFQGIESDLNITDTGNLYEYNQQISVSNQEEMNLTYFLDDINNWKVSNISTFINNIQDSRDWVNDSDFQSINATVNTEYDSYDTLPQYSNDETKGTSLLTITQTGALAMRVYFDSFAFEEDYDFLYIEDKNDTLCFRDSGYRNNFYSPWIRGDTVQIYIVSDSSIRDNGYVISSYQYLDGTFDNNWWGFNNISGSPTYYGPGYIDGNTGMYISLISDLWYSGASYGYYANYSKYDYMKIYQNLTIPRGSVIDAYINFDYYAEFALESNDFYFFVEINDQEIYSIGFGDIVDAGKNQWHSSNNIYMDLWVNNSKIFDNTIVNQKINISVGIKSRSSAYYQGFEDRYQQLIWFDNISLILTTIANSTQKNINLTINNKSLFDLDDWGSASLNISGIWDKNPVVLTINTTSPSLSFDLNTILFGYHNTTSKINQQNQEGVSYKILNNGTIIWEFLHNLYMPPQYENFEILIHKPLNWEILSVLDPTLQSRTFEGGKNGDNFIKINTTEAIFPGWWYFKATSPNYLNSSNTNLFKEVQWVQNANFSTGEFTYISTQLNYKDKIPNDVGEINLTIYHPNGTIFYTESKAPVNGNVTFSQITFSSFNTVGGIYEYTLFWSNSSALGGLKASFIVIHDCYLTILKPDDAKIDNTTSATLGDILPLRVYLRDAENDLYISNALISYNWTTGTKYFVEAALGIYETILDTADLGGYGLYNTIIDTSKIGFINNNLTFEINLGENTNLQRLDSDSEIIIHKNSTIRFFYYSEFDNEGIPGAQISVNISNSEYYTIQDLSEGIYTVEFSTEFFNNTGVYRLIFEFNAIGYEHQIHIYQFEVKNPPVIPENPNYLLWAILFASLGIAAILGALSLRSYVLLPRRRKKEAELLTKTQRFKDLKNIQAIVIIHKLSGIPIYSKSYSVLEKHKKELFSGFIQAITMIGEEFVEKEVAEPESAEAEGGYGVEKMIELDFKQFYCLIADIEDLRAVFILKERSSERLKSQVSHLILALNLKLSKELENWDGSLDEFEIMVPEILNEYFELYYKEAFKLAPDINLIKMKKEKKLTKMEMRIINVIQSMSKDNIIANLNNIVELVSEENKNLIIDAIESLIKQKLIIPLND